MSSTTVLQISNALTAPPAQALVLALRAEEARDERTDNLVKEVSQLSRAVLQVNNLLAASNARASAAELQIQVLQEQLKASEEARRRERDLTEAKIKQVAEVAATPKVIYQQVSSGPPPGFENWRHNMGAPLGR